MVLIVQYSRFVWLKQLDVMLYKVDAAKVAISHGLKLRQHVDKWLLVSLLLRGYLDFFASIFLQLNGSVLSYAYMFVDLQLSICARFVVYGFK